MALDPADIATVSRLLDEALALQGSDREAWLAALPPEHQRHAQALREMLEAHAGLDTDPRLQGMPRLPSDEAVAHAGDHVGPYRLLREIGRGGMGSVWLAERADGAFKRQVALKLPRLAWGAGLADRMAREREIGMLLEHPAIDRLYDAGVDERGRPYLALEYVDGQPIDAWCEAQGLTVRGRLRLFLQVARAVAYAHGRLVVHRDLKPSNVLVTSDGQAHLLDFGIAKLLSDAALDETGLTREQGRVLTPHYASPEQVAGEAITVQSDVYSLGVLLYELLTGSLPIAPKRSTLGAVEEAVLQGDAPLASSRVKDKATARALRGEIDAILAKAMQREPARRYATADALAQDIERHLNGETVAARPDSLAYRLRKGLRRYWVAVSAAAAVLLAVLTGSGVAVVQAQRAARSAERERVIKAFVADVFRVSSHSRGSGANMQRTTAADDHLQAVAGLIEVRFPAQPDIQAELLGVVGDIFSEMGAFALAAGYAEKEVAAVSASGRKERSRSAVLQRWADALLHMDKLAQAEERADQALGVANNAREQLQALVLLARIRAERGDMTGSEAAAAQARALDSNQAVTVSQAWLAYLSATAAWRANQTDRALAEYRRAADLGAQAEGPTSLAAAEMRTDLAFRYLWNNRPNEGQVQFDLAQAALQNTSSAGRVRAAVNLARWWQQLSEWEQAPHDEALRHIRAGRATLEATAMVVPELLRAEVDLAEGAVLAAWGDLRSAEPLVLKASAVLRAGIESLERSHAISYVELSLLENLGRHAEALDVIREFDRVRRLVGLDKTPYGVQSHFHLALNDIMAGNFARAQQTLDRAPTFEPLRSDPLSGFVYPEMLPWQRARLELLTGHPKAALAALSGLHDDADKTWWHSTHALRAEIYCASGREAEGLVILRDVIAARRSRTIAADPATARHRGVAGLCALGRSDRQLAREFAAQARAAFTAQPGVSPYYKAPLFKLERALGLRLPPV